MTAVQATAGAGRVPARTAARVAWSLCVASLILMTLAIVVLLRWRNARFQIPPEQWASGSWAEQLAAVAGSLGAPVLGAVIASHQPRNRYGWLWCTIGFTLAVGSVTTAYASYSFATLPGGLPGALAAAWLANSVSIAASGLLLFAYLLFPNGRLPSPGWRTVGWITATVCVGYPLFAALRPGPLLNFPSLTNPVGIGGPGAEPIAGAIGGLFWTTYWLLIIFVAPATVLIRFWRARGQERQQLKWLAVVGALVLAREMVSGFVPEEEHPLGVAVTFAIGSWAIYAAIGIAVVRHRLYDIDRLFNRTLVYGLLTAVLGVVYVTAVFVLNTVLFGTMLRATYRQSSLAVATSTLAVAALFQPARRRIQAMVDRRFNRRRFDATKTVEAFSTRLRDQIDLDSLTRELLAVVDQTVEPTRVSLWLRSAASTSRRPAGPQREHHA
jgi:hypothetical protein